MEKSKNRKGRKLLYSKEDLIWGIKKAWAEGRDVRYTSLFRSPENSDFKFIPINYLTFFKNYENLISSSGLSMKDVEKRAFLMKRGLFLNSVKEAYEEGLDMSALSIKKGDNILLKKLYTKARYFYSGRSFWEKTLEEAELPVRNLVKQRVYDKERIIEIIRKRKRENLELTIESIEEEYPSFSRAIKYHFGGPKNKSFVRELKNLGLNENLFIPSRNFRSLEELVDIFKERVQSGKSISTRDLIHSEVINEYKAVKRIMSWEEFCINFNLPFEPERNDYVVSKRKNKRKLALERLKKESELGIFYNFSKKDSAFDKRIRRLFGSVEAAAKEANLIYFSMRDTFKGILVDPKNINIIFENSQKYLEKIVFSVYFNSSRRIPVEDLKSQAFIELIDSMSSLPKRVESLEKSLYWKIKRKLIETNRDFQKYIHIENPDFLSILGDKFDSSDNYE